MSSLLGMIHREGHKFACTCAEIRGGVHVNAKKYFAVYPPLKVQIPFGARTQQKNESGRFFILPFAFLKVSFQLIY